MAEDPVLQRERVLPRELIQPLAIHAFSLGDKRIRYRSGLVILPVKSPDGGVSVAEDGF